MNQVSTIPFGTDATLLAGYMSSANDRLGNIDLTRENTGANTLYFKAAEQTNPSGAFVAVGSAVSIVPGGVKTLSYNLISQKLGFFGSGDTTANATWSIRTKGDLRGAQIDIVITGRRGWGYDPSFNKAADGSPQNWPGFNTLI